MSAKEHDVQFTLKEWAQTPIKPYDKEAVFRDHAEPLIRQLHEL